MSTQSKIISVTRIRTRERVAKTSDSIGAAADRILMPRATTHRVLATILLLTSCSVQASSDASASAEGDSAVLFKKGEKDDMEALINDGDAPYKSKTGDDALIKAGDDGTIADAEVTLDWISAEGDDEGYFKVKIDGQSVDTAGEDWLGIEEFKDGKLEKDEWYEIHETSWFVQETFDFANWIWVASGIGILVLLGIGMYFCFKSSGDQQVHQSTPHTGYGGGYSYTGRRLQHNPFNELSCQIDDPTVRVANLNSKPIAQSAQLTNSETMIPQPGTVIVILLSCVTQVFWIYVAVRLYKSCCKKPEKHSPREELREITVRR